MEKGVESIFEDLFIRYPELKVIKKDIWNVYVVLREMYKDTGTLYVAGNGGSASDAEHIVGELMKGFTKRREISEELVIRLEELDEGKGHELLNELQGGLPAVSLTGESALSTAFLNDVNPYMIYAQMLSVYGKKGDSFMAISTSGNSKNILYACIVAKAKGMHVIGLTGSGGGELLKYADISIRVPSSETYKIQELHLPVYHTLCLMLEETFFTR